MVERTANPVQAALKDAGITASELGKVLLVGGSTRVPAVQDKEVHIKVLGPLGGSCDKGKVDVSGRCA